MTSAWRARSPSRPRPSSASSRRTTRGSASSSSPRSRRSSPSARSTCAAPPCAALGWFQSMSEAAREREIHALRERYARGDLTSEEFDDRLDALFAARPTAEPDEQMTASGADLDLVERHLSPGEQTEWVGRPDPAKHLTRGDV